MKKALRYASAVAAVAAGLVLAAPLAANATTTAASPTQVATFQQQTAMPTMPGVNPPPANSNLKATGAFSVSINSITTDSGAPVGTTTNGPLYTITSTSTGYSAGNWLNVWARPTGTTTWTDMGGNWVPAGGNVKSALNLPYASGVTSWDVELSLGKNPNEAYSPITTVSYQAGNPLTPWFRETGVNGSRYIFITGATSSKKTPGSEINLTLNKAGNKAVGTADVDASGMSYTYLSQNNGLFKNTGSFSVDGPWGDNSYYYNYY